MGVSEMVLILLAVVGLMVPLVGIVLLVKGCRRSGGLGFPACGHCQYDVSATIGTSSTCPECGQDLGSSGVMSPEGKRSTGLIVAGALVLLVSLGCLGPLLLSIMLPALTKARNVAQTIQAQKAAETAAEEPASLQPQSQEQDQPEVPGTSWAKPLDSTWALAD